MFPSVKYLPVSVVAQQKAWYSDECMKPYLEMKLVFRPGEAKATMGKTGTLESATL